MKTASLAGRLSLVVLFGFSSAAIADEFPDPAAVKEDHGAYYDAKGDPTFNVREDGTVDWPTYSGFRHYEAECLVCHGPEGEGSSYAPALKDSLLNLNYARIRDIIAVGKQEPNTPHDKAMHAFGDNKNVMCYLNDIYVYLRARANDAVPLGRPQNREDKPLQTVTEEALCLGTGKS